MKTSLFALLLVGLVSGSASFAADSTDGKTQTLAVGKIMCDKIYVSHTPSPDVAFQSAVDVDGNPVAPADLTPPVNVVPDYMEVPMTYDLAKSMNLSLPQGVEMNAVIGTLKLYTNGRVEYNGQDISTTASEYCGETLPVAPPVHELPREMFEPAGAKLPAAGSVAPSATVEPPRPEELQPKFPRGAVNITR